MSELRLTSLQTRTVAHPDAGPIAQVADDKDVGTFAGASGGLFPGKSAASSTQRRTAHRLDLARPVPSSTLRFDPSVVAWTPLVQGFLHALQASGVRADLRKEATISLETFRAILDLPWVRDHAVEFGEQILLAEDVGLTFRVPPPQFAEGARLIFALLASSHLPGAGQVLDQAIGRFGSFLPGWRDAQIGPDGQPRLKTAYVHIPTAGTDPRPAAVELYGYPTRQGDGLVVFYRVHLDADRNPVDVGRRPLRSMPFERFSALAESEFRSHLWPGKVLLAPAGGDGFLRLCRISKAPEVSDDLVHLADFDGRTHQVSVRDLLLHNLGASTAALEAFEALHKEGGRGRIMLVTEHDDPSQCGHFLQIDQLPHPPSGKLPRFLEHPEVTTVLADLKARGVPLLLVGEHDRPGLVATTIEAGGPTTSQLSQLEPSLAGKPALVFKPLGGLQSQKVYFALEHERVHVGQQLEGRITHQREILTRLRTEGLLTGVEPRVIDSFLGEQPAYARQLECMAMEDGATAGKLGGAALPSLANERQALVRQFSEDFAAPVRAVLERLAAEADPTALHEVVALLRRTCTPSADVGLQLVGL